MNKREKKLIFAISILLLAVVIYLFAANPSGQEAPAPSASPELMPEAPAPSAEASAPIQITELMEKNRATIMDESESFPDWIELYNPTDRAVKLEGWSIADGEDEEPWVFPNVRIGANSYLLIYADGKDSVLPKELHTDFSLSADETVYLRDPNGNIVSTASCGGCDADYSMALNEDGLWEESAYPSPKYANSYEGYEKFQQTQYCTGSLAISEVMTLNQTSFSAMGFGYCDWVELKNPSPYPIDLSDYYISNDKDDRQLFRLPNRTLAPGGCFILMCSGEASTDGAYASAPFNLDSDNEQLYLSTAVRTVDYISLKNIPYDHSYGRVEGEGGHFFIQNPSPGVYNYGGYRRISEAPTSLTRAGVYEGVESVKVELSCPEDGIIIYTLDGSAPSFKNGSMYSEPIELSSTAVLRAITLQNEHIPSRPLTLNFIINEGHSLPVVCLNADDPEEFDSIYIAKKKDTELAGSLSFYRGDESFSIGCGVSLNGETSLTMPKKNMSLRFRGAYGQAKLEHDIFGGGVTEFTNLLLRAGQDQDQAIIRNELAQRMCELANANVVNQRSIYCVLYINGEYRGLYTLKEKSNEQLYASLAGVSKSSVEVVEAPAAYGSELYEEVLRFPVENDMSLDENYQTLCQRVDIDSLIDWLIMEGYSANTDVTIGNLRYCRSAEADGKWHFMFYDLDASFRHLGSMYYNLMTDYGYQNIQVSSLAYPLMQNEDFRHRFLTRASELLSTVLTNENLLKEIDDMEAHIGPEVKRDFGRMNRSVDDWLWNLNDLREMITYNNWRQCNIEALCQVFELSAEERQEYFGDIDGK